MLFMTGEIHTRLKQARVHAGYRSAISFAAANGLTESTYSSHENGSRGITLHSAKKYAALLGISEVWLLTGEGNMAADGMAEPVSGAFQFTSTKPTPPAIAANERKLHKAALAIAKEVLENRGHNTAFEEANDLAWRMVDLARQYGNDKLNAEMAEWLLTWEE